MIITFFEDGWYTRRTYSVSQSDRKDTYDTIEQSIWKSKEFYPLQWTSQDLHNSSETGFRLASWSA